MNIDSINCRKKDYYITTKDLQLFPKLNQSMIVTSC